MLWRLLLVVAGLLIALYLWHWGRPVASAPAPIASSPTTGKLTTPSPIPVSPAGTRAGAPADVLEGFEGLQDLDAPNSDVTADLRIVQAVLEAFRTSFPAEGNPTGSNTEITAALAGANRLRLVLSPRGHPAINPDGELCDRWGTPYFFHSESRRRTTVRSAGPDRRMWTADDIEHAP
jgi:hypothetical protein